MCKKRRKPKPRKIKGATPKQNKWNSGEFCRSKLLLGGRGILRTEYSRVVKNKQNLR